MSGFIHFLFGENTIIYLQSLGNPFLDRLFLAITSIGSQPLYFFLASITFWCFSKKTGIKVMYVILISAFMAIYAKNLFGMPRPAEHLHKIPESGFGFPSSHAQVASGFWGYLVCKINNPWLIFAGAAAIFSVSLSRVYLGVHYPGDVLGGILFGLSVALISSKTESAIINKSQRLGRRSKYLLALILPLILVVIAYIQSGLLTEQVNTGMVMAGIGAGYLLEEERINFEDAKNNKQRITRGFIGVSLLAIIYLASSMMLLINKNFIFFEYAAMGFTSTFIVPRAIARMEC